MSNQQDFDLDIDLFTDPSELGQLHGQDQAQQDLIVERGASSGFYIRATLGAVAHGFYGPSKTPATLIVFDFIFQSPPDLETRKFESARLEFTFTKDPEGTPAQDPVVVSFAPGDPVTLNSSDGDVTTVHQLNLQPNVTVAGTGGGLGNITRGETVVTKKEYSTKLQGQRAASKGLGRTRPNQVIWYAAQNTGKKDGIPPRIATAVLLERQDSKFSCKFQIKATVDFRHGLVQSVKKLFGATKPDKPIIFDPTIGPQGTLTQMTKAELDDLAAYIEQAKIVELAKIQMATQWPSK